MNNNIKTVYRELEDRFVKISWTHKIQEIQADLYLKELAKVKMWMSILNALTSVGSFATLITLFFNRIGFELGAAIVTTCLAVINSYFTFRYKDNALDEKAAACKKYAAKCRHIRNRYEALLTDIKNGRYNDIETVCTKRDEMTDVENDLFCREVAPHTSSEACTLASKALKSNKESLTEDKEIETIVPKSLQMID